jgi:hypothetical protein
MNRGREGKDMERKRGRKMNRGRVGNRRMEEERGKDE